MTSLSASVAGHLRPGMRREGRAPEWSTRSSPPSDLSTGRATDEKVLGLTFDDGPDPVCPPRGARRPRAHGRAGHLFVLADRAEEHPDVGAGDGGGRARDRSPRPRHRRLPSVPYPDAWLDDGLRGRGRRRHARTAGSDRRSVSQTFATWRAARRHGLEVVVWAAEWPTGWRPRGWSSTSASPGARPGGDRAPPRRLRLGAHGARTGPDLDRAGVLDALLSGWWARGFRFESVAGLLRDRRPAAPRGSARERGPARTTRSGRVGDADRRRGRDLRQPRRPPRASGRRSPRRRRAWRPTWWRSTRVLDDSAATVAASTPRPRVVRLPANRATPPASTPASRPPETPPRCWCSPRRPPPAARGTWPTSHRPTLRGAGRGDRRAPGWSTQPAGEVLRSMRREPVGATRPGCGAARRRPRRGRHRTWGELVHRSGRLRAGRIGRLGVGRALLVVPCVPRRRRPLGRVVLPLLRGDRLMLRARDRGFGLRFGPRRRGPSTSVGSRTSRRGCGRSSRSTACA